MKVFKVDKKIYSEEALKLSAFICGGEKINIAVKKDFCEVSINGDNEDILFKEFLNEALNQQCRIDLAAKNSRLVEIITTKILLSAMGEK